jgi:acyl-CoA thioesterase I
MAGGGMYSRVTRTATACVAACVFSVLPVGVSADDHASLSACHAPTELTRLAYPLKRSAQRLSAGESLRIVAIGSSSTAGAGASSIDASYPSRLAIELQHRFPGNRITVINRGVNGEEVRDMLKRFPSNVIAEKPDLVLWQVGTNAVMRDDPLVPANTLIRDGVAQLKAIGADVVLMDPQFAPRVIAKPEIDGMVRLISAAAKDASVDLFPRFAVMRIWHDKDGLPFETFVSPDGLHMNDWGYACVATLLSAAIAEASTGPTMTVHATAHAVPTAH